MQQRRIFGFGALNSLADILKKFHGRPIMLVTGRNSYTLSGAALVVEKIVRGYSVVRFSEVGPMPKLENIARGIEMVKHERPGIIIAVGGGSVIDTAKSIAVLGQQDGNPGAYVTGEKKIGSASIPVVAIPTTAGSGSEATQFAVVYVDHHKYSLDDREVLPKYALVDPALMMSLSAYQTACSGVDALAQGIESYWSVAATKQSQKYAAEAITLCMNYLTLAIRTPSREGREKMAWAAHQAGRAINISRTTGCHALSYPMTAHFNVVHGQAVGLTLGKLFEFNAGVTPQDCADSRGDNYVRKTISKLCLLLGCTDAFLASEKITALLKDVGLQTTLNGVGIGAKDVDIILREGFNPERVGNNPRKLTAAAAEKILCEII